jgi:putative transposase
LPLASARGRGIGEFVKKKQSINIYKFNSFIFTMPYIRIWVHLVFATKKREPLFKKDIREPVYQHIINNCKDKGIFLEIIGGYVEHIHCLISLGSMQTIAEVTQLIKGESSFWVNKNQLVTYKFEWQNDYYAVSVSESQVKKVIRYIENQEIHHACKSYEQEEKEIIDKYGFTLINDKLSSE